jgi:hypothetical protein
MKRAGRKQETNAPRAQASARPVRPVMQTHEGAVSSIATPHARLLLDSNTIRRARRREVSAGKACRLPASTIEWPDATRRRLPRGGWAAGVARMY